MTFVPECNFRELLQHQIRMEYRDETFAMVERLKKRLVDAVSDASGQQEDNIGKTLKQLSLLPMSIEILKVTQIGKQVNSLRKWGGKVSSKAKSLVRKWKQLLPESEDAHQNHHSSSPAEMELIPAGMELVPAGMDVTRGSARKVERRKDLDMSLPVIHIESGDSDVSVMEVTKKHSESRRRKKKLRTSNLVEDEFSKALEVPLQYNKVSSSNSLRSSSNPQCSSSNSQYSSSNPQHSSKDNRPQQMGDVVVTGTSHRKVRREESPADVVHPELHNDVSTPMKCKEPQPVLIGHTKRSRTQVYSGKRAQTGPQVVSSLFDMCMKILIDNIDMIEEVGCGVPYHVLEPLLQKCSAVQLLRLEEFNPHLIEDTDNLWRKHVIKDFKITKLISGDTWRELYEEKLAEKEEKLRNLTARIKANNHAREEPVRKVKIADAVRKPGRRSGSGFKRGVVCHQPFEQPHAGSQLMKRTMKMAKERNHMMAFKSRKT